MFLDHDNTHTFAATFQKVNSKYAAQKNAMHLVRAELGMLWTWPILGA